MEMGKENDKFWVDKIGEAGFKDGASLFYNILKRLPATFEQRPVRPTTIIIGAAHTCLLPLNHHADKTAQRDQIYDPRTPRCVLWALPWFSPADAEGFPEWWKVWFHSFVFVAKRLWYTDVVNLLPYFYIVSSSQDLWFHVAFRKEKCIHGWRDGFSTYSITQQRE